MTTEEVCAFLGVEGRRVRALAEGRFITRVAHGVFDRTSVERYRTQRGSGRTRTWAPHTAWGAIALLSNAAPVGLDDVHWYRLRATLRDITDPADLAVRLRDRAIVATYSGVDHAVIDGVRRGLVVPGRKRLGLAEDDTVVDGYIQEDQVGDLVHRYRLVEDPNGPVTLRYTHMHIGFIEYLANFNRTLAAVDAATSSTHANVRLAKST